MLRSFFLASFLTLGLAFSLSAQVVVNGGYATTYPVGVPAPLANTVTTYGIPSVPAINTPVAHVGPTAEQTPPQEVQGTAGLSPATPTPIATGEQSNLSGNTAAGGAPTYLTQQQPGTFAFGAASFSVNPFSGPGTGTNGESLGQVARQYKQKDQNVNAKVYTNADIEKLEGNAYGGAAATAANDNWPANNGVISQPAANPQPPAVAAPAQNQSTTGTAPISSPFSPRPEANSAPTPQPQSLNQKPSPDRPVEVAHNNPANAGIPQTAGSAPNTGASAANAENGRSQNTLPKTATRLPLLGVLGFFSITVGMFVRHQRSKAAR